jgi:hypothetical protein
MNLLTDIQNNYKDNNKIVDLLYSHLDVLQKSAEMYISFKDAKLSFTKLEDINTKELKELFENKKQEDDSEIYLYSLFRSIQIILYTLLLEYKKIEFDIKDEVINEPHKRYLVNISDKVDKRKLFSIFVIIYYLETHHYATKSEHKKQSYLGVDFEFNVRQIALMQLNFEGKYFSCIFLTNPADFEPEITALYTKYIMENRFILKILHGSDSLDIPYLYQQFFQNKKDTIIKFTKNMIDTRFMCEFFKAVKQDTAKCTIYNALTDFKVIDAQKLADLNKMNEEMGHIQDISWLISNLSSKEFEYSARDVLYLKYLYRNIIKECQRYSESTKMTISYLPDVIHFIFLERRSITDILVRCKKEVDPINNYLIFKEHQKQNFTLISIFNKVMENIELKNNIDIKSIITINYFRTQLGLLLKKITYTLLTQHFRINVDKRTIFNQSLSINWIIDELKVLKLSKLIDLIKQFEIYADNKIQQIL